MASEVIRLLQKAIKANLGCQGRLVRAVVAAEFSDMYQPAWEGIVYVFELIENPAAELCYAWDSGAGIVIVLHNPPVDSPRAALRAAIRAGKPYPHSPSG